MKEEKEWKTGFCNQYSLYEFLVMLFGLTKMPATFQNMMNYIFWDMIDLDLLAYIDDLLINAKTKEEYVRIVKDVLQRLWANSLAISAENCRWKQPKVEFL